MNPNVSVLLPVYNGEKYLRQSIESVLSQTYDEFELIAIDDGSTDRTGEIIESYCDSRIKRVKNETNLGLIATLNKGIELARGRYIARQDADDISHPERLAKQVRFLDDNPEVAVLGSQADYIDQNGRFIKVYGLFKATEDLAIRWQLIFDNPFIHSSVMMRTPMVRESRGYCEKYLTCEDFDLWERLAQGHGLRNLPERLIAFRSHSGSVTSNSTMAHNLKAGDIFHRSYVNILGTEPPDDWVHLWISVNNPYRFEWTGSVSKIIAYLEMIRINFMNKHPGAEEKAEIRDHITHMLLRMAYNLTLADRSESVKCLFAAMKRDLRIVGAILPKYLAALILGKSRKLVSRKKCT